MSGTSGAAGASGASGFDGLRRWPDLEAGGLRAWDTADALILDEAAPLLADSMPGTVVVVGDDFGALTLGALERGAQDVRVHQDELTGERALAANAASREVDPNHFRSLPLTEELAAGAAVVLLRLPRSLAALGEITSLVADHAAPGVVVIGGARIKHMSRGMNAVLQRRFATLEVSLGRQKSRLLVARGPQPGEAHEPEREFHDDLQLWVVATGGVFAGTAVDIGTRALLDVLDRLPEFDRAVDLGCGTGILAAALARHRPGAPVLASDRSAAAVASARLTLAANGIEHVTVTRDDALSAEPDASADLVLLNPPFHTGAAVDPRVANALFGAAARVLRPGGELWTVWNSHLAHRPALERIVGPTEQVSRTSKFTVTRSRRAARGR